jgi:hypothetical protein
VILRGVSIDAAGVDDKFTGLKGTEWADRPSYRIPLREYRELQPPVNRAEFLENPEYRDRISALMSGQHGLFFNREFKLNQGSYLTAAPPALVAIWDDIYRKKTGNALVPGLDIQSLAPPPTILETTLRLDHKIVVKVMEALRNAGLIVPEAQLIQMLGWLASKRILDPYWPFRIWTKQIGASDCTESSAGTNTESLLLAGPTSGLDRQRKRLGLSRWPG